MTLPGALGGALLLGSIPPALDALGRFLRAASRTAPPAEETAVPLRLLVLIPSRAEGDRAAALCRDLAREAETTKETIVDVVVILDGDDPKARVALRGAGAEVLVKEPAGPSKGAALAFATEALQSTRPEAFEKASYIMVFDADMRLPEGWLAALRVPAGAEAFQAPVRVSGRPAPGAARVEALSLAVATLVEDTRRDARKLPVRLRGKAMGFSPFAWARGPVRATETLVEDSEATILLLVDGITVRALAGPLAYDEPATGSGALAAPRARWLAGHAKLLTAYGGEILTLLSREPRRAAVLLFDLFLRPRAFVLLFLAGAFAVSAALAAAFLASGGLFEGTLSLLAALVSGGTIALEIATTRLARREIGFPAEVPPVRAEDLASALFAWAEAAVRGLAAPSRWHRARPER